MRRVPSALLALLLVAVGRGEDIPYRVQVASKLPAYDTSKVVVALLEDEAAALIPHLRNNEEFDPQNATASVEEVDVYAGTTALRVTPLQRFSPRIDGWQFVIAENPKAGEFRHLRFAWKKGDGNGIMVQLHDTQRSWCARYYAGQNAVGWEAKPTSDKLPKEWTVVTRDLFKDFGALTISGFAFTPMDGTGGLFDHVLLGRSVADLDAATDEALGRVKPKAAFDGKERDAAWAELIGTDAEKAGPALRRFLATAPDQADYLRDRLTDRGPAERERKAAREKVDGLVAKLADDSFDVREAAEAELARLGAAAVDEVAVAMKSPDAEVVFRATRLKVKLTGTSTGVPHSTVRAGRVVRVLQAADSRAANLLLAEMAESRFGGEYAALAKAALRGK